MDKGVNMENLISKKDIQSLIKKIIKSKHKKVNELIIKNAFVINNGYRVKYYIDSNSSSGDKQIIVDNSEIADCQINNIRSRINKLNNINQCLIVQDFEKLKEISSGKDFAKYVTPKFGGEYNCNDEIEALTKYLDKLMKVGS